MAAGNSSNTVFTTIPVGEDFYMSFSTERFFHNIYPGDILNVVFKLYDARIIGSVGNPNPNAIIETVDKSVTPGRFSVASKSVSVLVLSSTLDSYEAARTSNVTTTFRGELYGYAEVTVGGEETGEIIRLAPGSAKASLSAVGTLYEPEDIYWDQYFYPGEANISCKLTPIASLTIT